MIKQWVRGTPVTPAFLAATTGTWTDTPAFTHAGHYPTSNYRPTSFFLGSQILAPLLATSFTRCIWWLLTWFDDPHERDPGYNGLSLLDNIPGHKSTERLMHTTSFCPWGFLWFLCLRQVSLPWWTYPPVVESLWNDTPRQFLVRFGFGFHLCLRISGWIAARGTVAETLSALPPEGQQAHNSP